MLPVSVVCGGERGSGHPLGGAHERAGAMIDSGATHPFVSSALVARAKLQVEDAPSLQVKLADGSMVTSTALCTLPLFVADRIAMHVSCRVLDDLSHDVVLGIDWLQLHDPRINWRAFTVHFASHDLLVHCLPTQRVANVTVCSMASLLQSVRDGATAWFAFLNETTA